MICQDFMQKRLIVRQGHPELGRVYLSSTELTVKYCIKIETEHSVKVPVKSSDIKRVWKRYQTLFKKDESNRLPRTNIRSH